MVPGPGRWRQCWQRRRWNKGRHLHKAEEGQHHPAGAGAAIVPPDEEGEGHGDYRQDQAEADQGVAQGVLAVSRPEETDEDRPDDQIGRCHHHLEEPLSAPHADWSTAARMESLVEITNRINSRISVSPLFLVV